MVIPGSVDAGTKSVAISIPQAIPQDPLLTGQGLLPSGFARQIKALDTNGQAVAGFPFGAPNVIHFNYSDGEIAGLDEKTLGIGRFDPQAGHYSTEGISVISHDSCLNMFTISAENLGLFAIVGRSSVPFQLLPGFSTIACNYYIGSNNRLEEVLPNPADGTCVYKWNPSTGALSPPYCFYADADDGFWDPTGATLLPGEGALIYSSQPQTIIFSGEIREPVPRSRLPAGRYLVSCRAPRPCGFEEIMGFPPAEGDKFLRYADVTGQYSTNVFGPNGWDVAPILEIGKAAFVDLVQPQFPGIVQAPQNQTTHCGEPAIFTVSASGTGPLHYQWRLNGQDIVGATSPFYKLERSGLVHSGNGYSVLVSNGRGAVLSPQGVLTVDNPATGLTLALQGAGALLSWPLTCTNYQLEETHNLNPPITWTPLPARLADGWYHTKKSTEAPNTFFRLRQPTCPEFRLRSLGNGDAFVLQRELVQATQAGPDGMITIVGQPGAISTPGAVGQVRVVARNLSVAFEESIIQSGAASGQAMAQLQNSAAVQQLKQTILNALGAEVRTNDAVEALLLNSRHPPFVVSDAVMAQVIIPGDCQLVQRSGGRWRGELVGVVFFDTGTSELRFDHIVRKDYFEYYRPDGLLFAHSIQPDPVSGTARLDQFFGALPYAVQDPPALKEDVCDYPDEYRPAICEYFLALARDSFKAAEEALRDNDVQSAQHFLDLGDYYLGQARQWLESWQKWLKVSHHNHYGTSEVLAVATDGSFTLTVPAGNGWKLNAHAIVLDVLDSGSPTSVLMNVPLTTPDCNNNGVSDACDIRRLTSQDADHNGVPDECPP